MMDDYNVLGRQRQRLGNNIAGFTGDVDGGGLSPAQTRQRPMPMMNAQPTTQTMRPQPTALGALGGGLGMAATPTNPLTSALTRSRFWWQQ